MHEYGAAPACFARPTPSALIVGDTAPFAIARSAPDLAFDGLSTGDAERDPGRLVAADVVVWHGPCRSDVLEDLLAAVDRRTYALVVVTPLAQLDDWGLAVAHPGVELVVGGGDDAELAAAVGRALRSPPSKVGEAGDAAARLAELSDEVARIAAALAGGRANVVVEDRRSALHGQPGGGPRVTAAAVRALIRARRVRDRHFPGLFADPAWDILLDLYAARLEGGEVAVSSLCIAAAVPPTTALRWIAGLTEQGMLKRTADASDRRRVFIALSDSAAPRIEACIAAILATGMAVA